MSKTLVQQQFGANAAAYATSAPHAKGASLARLIEVVAPRTSWAALDVATGAGHTAAAFAPHVASVIASDITHEMLAEADKLADARGLTNLTTAVADAETLPFADATFDLVTCRIAPHHFADVPSFVSEAARVLKAGGTFALVDNVSPDIHSTPGHPRAALKDAAITYNTFEKLRDPSHVRALTLAEWLEVIDDAGLAVRHRELLPKAMSFPDWLGRMAVAAETVTRLEEILSHPAPALAAYLRPESRDGALWFTLDEALIVAAKAPS